MERNLSSRAIQWRSGARVTTTANTRNPVREIGESVCLFYALRHKPSSDVVLYRIYRIASLDRYCCVIEAIALLLLDYAL